VQKPDEHAEWRNHHRLCLSRSQAVKWCEDDSVRSVAMRCAIKRYCCLITALVFNVAGLAGCGTPAIPADAVVVATDAAC